MRLLENVVLDRISSSRTRDVSLCDDSIADLLLKRARLLDESDRVMIELHLKGRLSHREIARALKLKDYQVTRRLRSIGRRLHNPILPCLLDIHCSLPPEIRQLGIEYHLQDRTIRDIADRHRMNTDQVRKILVYLEGWRRGREGKR